jgi:hypothetical protein
VRIIKRIGYTPYVGGAWPPKTPPLYIIIRVTVGVPPKNFYPKMLTGKFKLVNPIIIKENS